MKQILVAAILLVCALIPAACQSPDTRGNLKPIAEKYVEVWNTGNLQELDGIIGPQFRRHSNLDPEITGIEALKKEITAFRTAYPDAKIVLEDEIYAENKSSARWTLTGTHTGAGDMPPTGKAVRIWGNIMIHYANGKITEEWDAFDVQNWMKQLGFAMTPATNQEK